MVIGYSQVISFQQKVLAQKKVVFTNGCFDLLHIGHIRYLQEARTLGDFLFVGINSDASVKKLKGPTRPIQNENDRAEILAALRYVDAVCVFDQEDPLELVKMVRPNILVKGGDWSIDKIIGSDFVKSIGGQTLSLPYVEGRSTTNIVNQFRA